MATIMSKRGQQDNVVTYEHVCDYKSDLANIPAEQATLGSVAIIIHGENDKLEVYIYSTVYGWIPIVGDGGVDDNYTLTVTLTTLDETTITGQTVTILSGNDNVVSSKPYNGQPITFNLPDGSYSVQVTENGTGHFINTRNVNEVTIENGEPESITITYLDLEHLTTAPQIQEALDAVYSRNVNLDLSNLIGKQINSTRGEDTLTWDIVNLEEYEYTPMVTLMLHDVFGEQNMMFSDMQRTIYCDEPLMPGNYRFHFDNSIRDYIITKEVPAGGQLQILESALISYVGPTSNTPLETCPSASSLLENVIDLGTEKQGLVNSSYRRFGSNNFAESDILSWLNSASQTSTPIENLDFAQEYHYNIPGFLYQMDIDFVECLSQYAWPCATNGIYECPKLRGGFSEDKDTPYFYMARVGLASEKEIFGEQSSVNSTPVEDSSTVFDFYINATNNDRIKYRNGIATEWFLRTPTNSDIDIRTVTIQGNPGQCSGTTPKGIVPVVKIGVFGTHR